MNQHTEKCRGAHGYASDEAELLHEVVERLDRLTAAVELVVSVAAPLVKGRLAKMAGGRAVAKVQAEWKAATDERH